MIAKGNRHNNGAKLARYMMTGNHEKDERAEFYQLRGFASDNIRDAFRDVEVMAAATKADNALFHVQVRLPEHERLTPQQWEYSADRIEKRLGLTDQPRAICFHLDEQTGERHMHVGWSLIDEEEIKAKPIPFFKFRLKALCRELEKEFDLTLVKNERDGPVKYAAKKNEQQQAQRLGINKDEIRNTIRSCWDRSDCGQSFQAALEHEGLTLTQGDRRGLVVVDRAGGLHALGKRVLDVNKSQMLHRLADLDLNELPHVDHARAFIQDLAPEPQREKTQPNWSRDSANERWEDAVITAAIEQEKIEGRFVDQKPQKDTRTGGRGKAGPVREDTANIPTDASKGAGLEMGSTGPGEAEPSVATGRTRPAAEARTGPVETARPRPILPEEPPGGASGRIHGTGQTVSAVVIAEQPSAAGRDRTIGGHVKRLFREVKRALTGKTPPAPELKKRSRRRREETRSGFRLAASIMRRVVWSIFHPGSFPWEPPCELDDAHRQQLHWNSEASLHEMDGSHNAARPPSNHLSPLP